MYLLRLLVDLLFADIPNHFFGDLRYGAAQLELQLLFSWHRNNKTSSDRRAIFLKTGEFRDHNGCILRQTKMQGQQCLDLVGEIGISKTAGRKSIHLPPSAMIMMYHYHYVKSDTFSFC